MKKPISYLTTYILCNSYFLGSGKFGTVHVVMNLTENCLMAMKQIRIERNDRALLALVDEVENLSLLDHPNLVKYYAVEVHRVYLKL